MRINDEPSDKQTVEALQALKCVDVQHKAEALCSAILALFNGRKFVSKFRSKTVSKFERAGHLLSKKQVLDIFDTLIQQTHRPADLFTSSFDRRQANKKGDDTKSTRANKVKKFQIKKAMKGGPKRQACTRKDLSLAFATQLSLLLGRNAFSLLEMHYLVNKYCHGRPAWVGEHGTLMGPGALMGGNLIAGEYKSRRSRPATTFADVVMDFQESTVHTKRLRRQLRAEVDSRCAMPSIFSKDRLTGLQTCAPHGCARLIQQLLEAAEDLLQGTDTAHEFLLCEISKIIDFVMPRSNMHAAHLRDLES
eukprot:s1605_g4.t1